MVGEILANGEKFYTVGEDSGSKVDKVLPEFIKLGEECKNLGDRYVFYQKLVQHQKTEKSVYTALEGKISQYADDSDKKERLEVVRTMPFGSTGGGSSGFKSFAVSAAVTEDFNACDQNPKKIFDSDIGKEWYCHKRRYFDRREGGQSRLEWNDGQRERSSGSYDWQEDVGDAHLQATARDGSNAVFTYVAVSSSAADANTDRRRYINHGAPAVGKTDIGFRFMSGHGDAVDWTIEGVAIRLRQADYPFEGLE